MSTFATGTAERLPPNASVATNVADYTETQASAASAPPLIGPILVLLVAALLIEFTSLDLVVAHALFDTERGLFPASIWKFLDGLDRFAPWVGILVGIAGLGVAITGRYHGRRWSDPTVRGGVFLAICLAVGPGLLVNGCLKSSWGRPRPLHLEAFGGEWDYRPFWSPGSDPEICKSFPSGHASIGFFLMAPAFLVYRRRRQMFPMLFAVGLGWGLLMGGSRIVQGAHFVSDVVWSCGLVYLVIAIAYRALDLERVDEDVT